MSAPIRFLGLAIIAYVGLRTASSALALDVVEVTRAEGAEPASEALAEATLPPGVPASMDPPTVAGDPYAQGQAPAAYGNPYA